MKPWSHAPILVLLFAAGHFATQTPAVAQSAIDRNAEERYRILTAKLDNLLESQQSILMTQQELKARLDALEREIFRGKEESARSTLQYVTRDDLKNIVEKVQEIDRKREADKRLILDHLKDLRNIPIAAPIEARSGKAADSERYKYTVKAGENLSAIISAYNEIYKNEGRALIGIADVVKANKDLNPDIIREGQVIEIPIPAKKR